MAMLVELYEQGFTIREIAENQELRKTTVQMRWRVLRCR
jgi:hypothetical protein